MWPLKIVRLSKRYFNTPVNIANRITRISSFNRRSIVLISKTLSNYVAGKRSQVLGYSCFIASAGGITLFLTASQTNINDKKLFRAAQYGNLQELTKICGSGEGKVSPDVRHPLGWTALMIAAANGHADVVLALIKLGAQLDLQDLYHNPQKTAKQHDLHPLDVLLKREDEFCETMNGRATYAGFTALHYASLADSEEVLKVLLDAGANPTLRDYAGRRPVDYAREGSYAKTLLTTYTKKMETILKDKQVEERRRFPLEQRLKQFIVGQQGAINTVAATIRRKENGWADDEHPLVFLFLGSSGIGKTELAKQVASYIHQDNPKGFIRLDMSEYQEKHEVAKLIGAPPGYIGHDDGGQLTKHLSKQKDAVVLFDEVDKAHPDVLTVLLQLFDEGRLTDGKGRTIECKNAIFVMTSNLASDEIARYGLKLRKEAEVINASKMSLKVSSDDEKTKPELHEEIFVSKRFKDDIVRPILKRHFGRDEFLGRINEIVYFLPFSRQELLTLVTMELNLWAKKAKSRHSIDLKWESGVLGCLADGYDVHYGARSIKYEVERRVVNKIALAAEKGMLGKDASIMISAKEDGSIDIQVKKKGDRSYTTVM